VKNKILFIMSLAISFLIIIHLFIIGFTFDSQIIIAELDNGNVNSMSKISLMIYISLLMVFTLGLMIPSYIKKKKINFNLFMAYLIFEMALNILPYFGN